jgi:hypothetical protein
MSRPSNNTEIKKSSREQENSTCAGDCFHASFEVACIHLHTFCARVTTRSGLCTLVAESRLLDRCILYPHLRSRFIAGAINRARRFAMAGSRSWARVQN